jgi:hypothetical protein
MRFFEVRGGSLTLMGVAGADRSLPILARSFKVQPARLGDAGLQPFDLSEDFVNGWTISVVPLRPCAYRRLSQPSSIQAKSESVSAIHST